MFTKLKTTILEELRDVFDRISQEELTAFVKTLSSAKRVFTIGAGREGLATKAFAMRLAHLGKESHWIWDDTTPAIEKGDVCLVVCGPAHLDSVCNAAMKAHDAGAILVLVTASEEGSLHAAADVLLRVPASAYKAVGELVPSVQPMGTLFEQALFLLYDMIVLLMCDEMKMAPAEMSKRHRNVE